MFWILRRTGAANFFNSFNNNCSTSKANNNSTNDKYVKRPPRKAYGRLSADSDDGGTSKMDNSIDDVDNFEMIASNERILSNGNNNEMSKTMEGSCFHNDNDGHKSSRRKNVGSSSCALNECHGIADGDVCDFADTGLCSVIENNGAENKQKQKQKEVNQNTINRLHAMSISDDDDFDEALTCNVCDRAFACYRQLASHQQKKRHFCCGGCDSLFPSLMLLEHHKEEFEHWSDDEISRRVCCRRNRSDEYFTDTDSFTSEAESEDLERLL